MEITAPFLKITKNPWEDLRSALQTGEKRIRIGGIKGSYFSFLVRRLSSDIAESILIITPDNAAAEEIRRALQFFADKNSQNNRPVYFFPDWEILPYDTADPHPEKVIARIECLYNLQQVTSAAIVVAPLFTLMQHCIPPSWLKSSIISIRSQKEYHQDLLINHLISFGYRRVSLVEERGEFSVRGGILDIFPPLYAHPVRIEFWGDLIDSIRFFNPITQRSIAHQEEIFILPVSEVILNKSTKLRATAAIDSPELKDKVSSRLRKMAKNKIVEEGHFSGIAFLLNLFYDSSSTITQYLPPNTIVCFYELPDWEQRISDYEKKIAENFALAQQKEKISGLGINFYLSSEETKKDLFRFTQLTVEPLEIVSPEVSSFIFSVSDHRTLLPEIIAAKSRTRPFAKLVEKIKEWLDNYFLVIIVVYSEVQRKRVHELLQGYGLPVTLAKESALYPSPLFEKGGLVLALGQLQQGFFSPPDRLAVLTEGEIFGEKFAYWKKTEPVEGEPIFSLDDLQVDDFIVHVDYGIGQYKGLYSLEVGGGKNDFLLIEYRDGDRLYVPVFRLNLIQKYRSGEEEVAPILNKLGSKAWANTKAKVKKAILAHAKELLRIYAARQALEGFSFGPRDQLYQEFEAQFEYEETPDQINTIEDVMRDMESSRPMDRLICGDAGYGKTEVALRASFKAVMNNKQVAVLVPTTILAYQHYQTFLHRFRNFPVNIAMLSRFQSPAEQKNIVAQLKEGTIDIVIGTHRLLQNDIGFKDLGLLVIDEEHRFGVRHKEKLKKLRMLVDVLTLTATPIPRTLQLSLMGIRDLSVIKTPPEDRLAVRTFITHFDGNIIREAIIREFMRNGQVFFVHNRVESIRRIADYLRELIPEANLAIAHGQMEEKALEKVMWAFHQGEINLLVCTTIIESGMDFPNANTIIINRADRLGVAQLYQLRGRVGRSKHQAYAYFLVPREPYLTERAKRRLELIANFSELGSGYRLATLDLELRGGGNILGLSQSGHMAQVGIELYYQLIEKAVREIKGEEIPPEVDPEIRLKVSAYLPEEYIPDIHQRLKIYKRLAGGLEADQIESLKEELRDRFGPLPESVENLLIISGIKLCLKNYLVNYLDFNGKEVILGFHPEATKSRDKILELIAYYKNRAKFTPDHRLIIKVSPEKDWKKAMEEVKKFFQ